MTRITPLRIARAAIVCLLPLPVMAQSSNGPDSAEKPEAAAVTAPATNWVTLGSQYNSSGSYYLGRYSGAVNPGFYGLGDFYLGQRDAWDSGGTFYWDAQGFNLGLPDRSFSARVGQQGTWGLSFYYDGIPYYDTNSFKSVYQTSGQLVPGVAPGSLSVRYVQILPRNGIVNSLWIPQAVNPATPFLFNYNLSTQRDVFGGTGKFQWGDWTISGAWRHEHKSGWQSAGIVFGGVPNVTTAGTGAAPPTAFTSGFAYAPIPIDYDSDRYDATAAYSTEQLQVQLGYTYSQFTDNNTVFNAVNPFAFTPTTTFGGRVNNIFAPYTLPPSNSAHQLRAMFGYNFTPTTRFNINFGYGVQLQNAEFVNGTGNPNLPPQTLPRASFDGLIQNYFVNAAFTTMLLEDLDFRLAYTLDDRDNQSPRNTYIVFPVSSNSSFTYSNLPYSYERQSVTAEAGYRIAPQTKLLLNDTFDYIYRTYANTSVVTTNRISGKIRSSLTDWAFATLSAGYENRDAHNYNSNAQWGLLCNFCNTEPTNLLMFNQVSRTHEEVKATVDISPDDTVTASLVVKFSNDQYPNDAYGLRNNHNFVVGPDVSWQVSPTLSAHAFYTYQQLYYNQNSIYQSPNPPGIPAPSATNTQFSVPWSANTTNSVQTFGVNMDWQAIPDVLKLSLDYNFSYGDTAYAFGEGVVAFGGAITSPTFGPSINFQPLPDVKSMLSVISLHGEYTFRPNMMLLFGYAWERFTYKDFMVGTPATRFANGFLPGFLAPNNSVHVISAALRFRF